MFGCLSEVCLSEVCLLACWVECLAMVLQMCTLSVLNGVCLRVSLSVLMPRTKMYGGRPLKLPGQEGVGATLSSTVTCAVQVETLL